MAGVDISIGSSSEKVVERIESIAKALEKLRDATKAVAGLSTLSDALTKINKLTLPDIPTGKAQILATSLSSFNGIKGAPGLAALKDDFKNLPEITKSIENVDLGGLQTLNEVNKSIEGSLGGAPVDSKGLADYVDQFFEWAKNLSALNGALNLITTIGKFASPEPVLEPVAAASSTAGQLSTATGGLSANLSILKDNMGTGLIILGEAAAAAVLFTGAVWLLGKELEQVGTAWEPVMANQDVIGEAMVSGGAILAGIGAITAGLGNVGKTLAANILLGIGILAELGLAAGLFILEITAIGKGLNQVGEAWQPVLDNGETIISAIGYGAAMLLRVGVASAALGALAVPGAGVLYVAIGLGTMMLVAISEAAVLFTQNLTKVARELSDGLAPALTDLNEKLPDLTENMHTFTDFMSDFAGRVAEYSANSAVAGLCSIVDTIIGWFTKDPFEKLTDDVENVYSQAIPLNDKLREAVPELETAAMLLRQYTGFVTELEGLMGLADGSSLSGGVFVNMKDVGANLVTGFVSGIESKSYDYTCAGTKLADCISEPVTTAADNAYGWGSDLGLNLADGVYSSAGYVNVSGIIRAISEPLVAAAISAYGWGRDLCINLANGINSNSGFVRQAVNAVANTIRSYLHFSEPDIGPLSDFHSYMPDMLQEMAKGIKGNAYLARDAVSDLTGSMSEELQMAYSAVFKPEESFSIRRDEQLSQKASYEYTGMEEMSARMEEANEELINVIYAVSQQVIRAINEKESDILMDGRKLTSSVTDMQNRNSRIYGKTMINS